jgi:hypothetical protein
MKVKAYLFSLSKKPDSLLAALAGFLLVLVFSKHSGIGISPDSVTYLSVARNFSAGTGFRSFDLLPVVDFPVGYPLLLSFISTLTKQDPLVTAPWLNGILFGILLYTSGSIMNGFSHPNPWYKRILLLCILFNPALQEVYSMLWSETVFLVFTLLFIICISNYLRLLSIKWLSLTILLCALSTVIRYAGVFLIPLGAALMLFNPSSPWRKKIYHVFWFVFLSLSLFLVNSIRNYHMTGFLTGQRQKGDLGTLKILEFFGTVFCDWLQINSGPTMAVILGLIVLIAFLFSILYALKKILSFSSLEFIASATGLFFSIFMMFSSFLTRYEQFSNRLLSAVFIPLLWSLSWWIPGWITRFSTRRQWIAGLAVLGVTAIFMNRQLAADYEYYDGVKDAGMPGYREDEFTLSGITQFVEKNKDIFDRKYPVYSNAGDAVYFITGLPAFQLPSVVFPEKLHRYYEKNNSYLVWFRDLENPEMPVLDSILRNKNMELIKQLPDGAVFFSR